MYNRFRDMTTGAHRVLRKNRRCRSVRPVQPPESADRIHKMGPVHEVGHGCPHGAKQEADFGWRWQKNMCYESLRHDSRPRCAGCRIRESDSDGMHSTVQWISRIQSRECCSVHSEMQELFLHHNQ